MAKSSRSKGGDLIRRIVKALRRCGGKVLGHNLNSIRYTLGFGTVGLQRFEEAVQEMKRLNVGTLTRQPSGLCLALK